jgi:hypothetical protein
MSSTITQPLVNITKYFTSNQNNSKIKQSILPYTVDNSTKSNSTFSFSNAFENKGISKILSYLFAIIIVLLVILLFIHFFIKPIFKLQPGASGIITVPGFDDGKLFWNKTNASLILNKDLPISDVTYNYSLIMDVFIQNPLQFANQPRIFFSRGASIKQTSTNEDTLLGKLNYYNLVAALKPDTNDMIVSVLNKDNIMENVIIPNAPVQEPFRLGIVLMENALEVYINGHLMKTRTLSSPPKDIKGDINPAAGVEANITKVRNLKIWNRLLNTNEIRYATPSLSTEKDFNATPIPTSSSTLCSNPK